MVKIDSGHKPKSTNILPKTLGKDRNIGTFTDIILNFMKLTNATIVIRNILFILWKFGSEAIEPEPFALIHGYKIDVEKLGQTGTSRCSSVVNIELDECGKLQWRTAPVISCVYARRLECMSSSTLRRLTQKVCGSQLTLPKPVNNQDPVLSCCIQSRVTKISTIVEIFHNLTITLKPT